MENNIINSTVIDLINTLRNSSLRFCIARNYENYPNIDNDLDLFYDSNIDDFRQIAINCAILHDWHYLLESQKWISTNYESSINVFIFYSKDFSIRLQIDLFHGFSILGAPLLSSNNIIDLSVYSDFTNCNVAGNQTECLIHIFQIASLINYSSVRSRMKFDLYYNKIINDIDILSLNNFAKKFGFYGIYSAILSLKKNEHQLFLLKIRLLKILFLIISIISHPVRTAIGIVGRFKYYLNLFQNPYFIFIKVHSSANNLEEFKIRLSDVINKYSLEYLVILRKKIDLLYRFFDVLRAIERGGIIILIMSEHGDLDFSLEHLNKMILKKLIRRDQLLWVRNS